MSLTKGQLEAKDELVVKLQELCQYTDVEYAHGEADHALLDFIERLTGDTVITGVYLTLERWYG